MIQESIAQSGLPAMLQLHVPGSRRSSRSSNNNKQRIHTPTNQPAASNGTKQWLPATDTPPSRLCAHCVCDTLRAEATADCMPDSCAAHLTGYTSEARYKQLIKRPGGLPCWQQPTRHRHSKQAHSLTAGLAPNGCNVRTQTPYTAQRRPRPPFKGALRLH